MFVLIWASGNWPPLLENNGWRVLSRSPAPKFPHLLPATPISAMAANSKTLCALQIIAGTSRNSRVKARKESTSRATPNVPTVLKPLPEHKPLLPLLLSHKIPSPVANACADRYDRCAGKLRSTTEAILVPHLMNHDKDQPAGIYSLFLNNYKQALRDWAQSILNAALKSLKRDPAELRDWDIIYPQPLWFPVSILCPLPLGT